MAPEQTAWHLSPTQESVLSTLQGQPLWYIVRVQTQLSRLRWRDSRGVYHQENVVISTSTVRALVRRGYLESYRTTEENWWAFRLTDKGKTYGKDDTI